MRESERDHRGCSLNDFEPKGRERAGAQSLESEFPFLWNDLSSVFKISHAFILQSVKANHIIHLCHRETVSVDGSEKTSRVERIIVEGRVGHPYKPLL